VVRSGRKKEPMTASTTHKGAPAQLDALIVGAGVIGLACAWRAAQRGLRVRVIDRGQPGEGASGVAAGMLAPVSEATWGEERLLELALSSADAWPAFATELARASGRQVGYLPSGALHVALDRDEAEELRRRFELMRSLGLDAEWLRPRECRRLEPGLTPRLTAGVHAAGEAAADPPQLLAALRTALQHAGGEILCGVEVTEAIVEGERIVGVRGADGRAHRAGRTVLATGCWSGSGEWLPEALRPPVRPVKGQILTLRGPSGRPACERIVVSERVYLVPRSDGRLIVGATVEERGFDIRVTAGAVHELLREAYRALPEVAELELVEAVAGLRPGTPDNAPLIGQAGIGGLIVASGHYRNGILLAPATATAVAALLAGEAAPRALDAFDPLRFETEAYPSPSVGTEVPAR
jgi:glycine oxidase